MKKRTRNILIKFFVTPEENALIEKNMALLGTENRSAFLPRRRFHWPSLRKKTKITSQQVIPKIPAFRMESIIFVSPSSCFQDGPAALSGETIRDRPFSSLSFCPGRASPFQAVFSPCPPSACAA